ncbi:MAG: hypothetical protein ACE5JI_11545, partial [Acidobacteriota bacterium]
WYLYPVGLALAVAGAMILLARSERRWRLFLLVGVTFSLFFFYKVRVWHDHFFAMRRFIPVILPTLFAAIAVFLVNLREVGGRWGRWAPGVIGILLLGVYFLDSRPLRRHNEFRGSLRFVENLARHIGDGDVVIFPRKEGLHLLELPLAELEGKKVLEFYTLRPDRKGLEKLMAKWRDRYDEIFFVTNYKISLSGLFTRHVEDFWLATEKYEFTYTHPPKRAEPFHLRFTLSKAVDLAELAKRMPKLPFIDVGESDDPLVAWFHEKELEKGVSFRWSQRATSVFLPSLGPESREIMLRMAGPREDRAPPSRVTLALNDQPLADLSLGPSFEIYRVVLPREVTSRYRHIEREDTFPVLTLASKTWRPSEWIPGATDIRDLGVRLDWVEVR